MTLDAPVAPTATHIASYLDALSRRDIVTLVALSSPNHPSPLLTDLSPLSPVPRRHPAQCVLWVGGGKGLWALEDGFGLEITVQSGTARAVVGGDWACVIVAGAEGVCRVVEELEGGVAAPVVIGLEDAG